MPVHLSSNPTATLAVVLLSTVVVFAVSGDQLWHMRAKRLEELREFRRKRDRFAEKRDRGYHEYGTASAKAYAQWRNRREGQLRRFKREVAARWGSCLLPTNKKWIEYGYDLRSRAEVDFEEGEVQVSILTRPGEEPDSQHTRMADAIERLITSRGHAPELPLAHPGAPGITHVPLLDSQLVPSPNPPRRRAEDLAREARVDSVSADGASTMSVRFKLVPNHLQRRVKSILPLVEKNCRRFGLDRAEVLATIHTESYFNPVARSPRDAIGLMQLVPDKAGREAYRFIFGEDKIPLASYLLDPARNIELGCAYMHLLRTRHFGEVRDSLSRIYCSIAGYNTGPGNVAYAFIGKRGPLGRAIVEINRTKTPRDVYHHLLQYLPYEETRGYLRQVTRRMKLYR